MHVHVYFDASPLKQSPQTFHQLNFLGQFQVKFDGKNFHYNPPGWNCNKYYITQSNMSNN